MNHDLEHLAARAAPAIFVVLWSTGFIATKYVLHNVEPLTYLAIRTMPVPSGHRGQAITTDNSHQPDHHRHLVHGFYLGGTAVAQ